MSKTTHADVENAERRAMLELNRLMKSIKWHRKLWKLMGMIYEVQTCPNCGVEWSKEHLNCKSKEKS